MDYGYKKIFIMKPGLPQRVFLTPPLGSTYAIVTLRSPLPTDIIPIFLQHSHSGADKITVYGEYHGILKQNSNFGLLVYPSTTEEFCLTQCWSFPKQSKIKMEIKFIGYDVKDLILSSTNSINKITFKNNFHSTSIRPSLNFTKICQTLNVLDASIETVKDRKDLDDGGKSLCMLLTYKLNVIKENTFMFTLEGILEYSKYLDSISYQINTKSKMLISTFSESNDTLLRPGIYEISVKIRNSNLQMLEKLKTVSLLVDEFIAPIEANLYDNAASALKKKGKKFDIKDYQPGQKGIVYVASIPHMKFTTSYPTGSYLEGIFSLSSDFDKLVDEYFENFKVRYYFAIKKIG